MWPLRDQRGAFLVELLLSTTLTLVVVGGLLTVFDSVRNVYTDRLAVLGVQQVARIAMERLKMDLHATGVGLAWSLPPTPLIIPRADGGVDLRENIAGLATALRADMGSSTSDIDVINAAGFSVGDKIAIYDAGGSIDYTSITNVDLGNDRIAHLGATKAYLQLDGAAIARITTISLYVDDIGGVQTLVRSVNGGAPLPLADGIVEFTISYYDNAQPPMPFAPDTIEKQTRVKGVDLVLRLRTPMPGGDPYPEHEIRLVSRVTPRALALS